MAASQQTNINKSILIDDTQPLSCFIQTTETEGDHIVYLIKVQRGFDTKYSWQIKKRYNEFNELYNQLKVSNYELALPPKKAFGNMKKEFLSTRQIGLQEFMDKILANLLLANSLPVKRFLDEENYSGNFREQALAHVSMFFRSESNWEVIEPLNDIGWRFRKKCILLKNNESPSNKYILTWCEHGPDKILKEADLKVIFNQITQIQHEFIDPIFRINSGENSTIIIQKYNEKVISLRDFICGTNKINANYLKKYSLNKTYQKFPVDLIKLIAKKILVVLQYIYSKGLFFGHLHTGNILIEPNTSNIKLTDLANSLLGLPYFFRSYVIENRKIQNIELVDVYGFGLVLYEMIYGEPLLHCSTKSDFNDCPIREFKSLLDLLLCDDVISKNGLPTINQLLEMPFFKSINVDNLPASSLSAAASTSSASNKLFASSKVKELLIKAREYTERKMNDEQKMLYKLKRQSQAEAKLFSDEQVRKRRKEKKKAEKESLNTLEFPTSPTSPLSINGFGNGKKYEENKKNSLSSSFKSDSTVSGMDNLSIQDTNSPPTTLLLPVSPPLSPAPPPPPPPPPILSSSSSKASPGGPPPPPPLPSGSTPKPSADRSQLLSSINSFSIKSLKKSKTNDRSAPKIN